jgi:hypothetical protein
MNYVQHLVALASFHAYHFCCIGSVKFPLAGAFQIGLTLYPINVRLTFDATLKKENNDLVSFFRFERRERD